MSDRPRSPASAAALLLMFSGAMASAEACGFDGILDGSFSAMHPKSLAVAFAIRNSIESRLLDESAAAPIVPGQAGFWRASAHLDGLRRVLSSVSADALRIAPPVSVLFIDSSLWARLMPGANGYTLEVHTSGANPGDVTIVTSEAMLAVALKRSLGLNEMLAHGLIAVDGETEPVAAVLDLLRIGLSRAPVDVQAQSIRSFGRMR